MWESLDLLGDLIIRATATAVVVTVAAAKFIIFIFVTENCLYFLAIISKVNNVFLMQHHLIDSFILLVWLTTFFRVI